MAWRARNRSQNRRASGLKGNDRGWLPGSSQANSIGIPTHLINKVRQRTNTLVHRDSINNIAGGNVIIPPEYKCNDTMLLDTKCLVVQQNQIGGVGRFRSQFNINADGIKIVRYFLNINDKGFISENCNCKPSGCFICIDNNIYPLNSESDPILDPDPDPEPIEEPDPEPEPDPIEEPEPEPIEEPEPEPEPEPDSEYYKKFIKIGNFKNIYNNTTKIIQKSFDTTFNMNSNLPLKDFIIKVNDNYYKIKLNINNLDIVNNNIIAFLYGIKNTTVSIMPYEKNITDYNIVSSIDNNNITYIKKDSGNWINIIIDNTNKYMLLFMINEIEADKLIDSPPLLYINNKPENYQHVSLEYH